MRRDHLFLLSMIVPFAVPSLAIAQDSRTICSRDFMGRMECTTTQDRPRVSFGESQAIRPEEAQRAIGIDPSFLESAATAGMRGSEDAQREHEARQAAKESKMAEARRLMIANPERAELIAKLYDVPISAEMKEYLDAIRAEGQASGNSVGRGTR